MEKDLPSPIAKRRCGSLASEGEAADVSAAPCKSSTPKKVVGTAALETSETTKASEEATKMSPLAMDPSVESQF